MSEVWKNCGYEIHKTLTSVEQGGGRLGKTTNFTQGAIRKASLQWYKMKWQFTASANDLWGEEVQGFAENISPYPLGTCPLLGANGVTPVRLRFFNLLTGDDAANDFRCAFLKFSDSNLEGPLDLAFTTGRVPCFDTTSGLQTFLTAMDGDEDSVRDWALRDPINYFALADGLRRFPRCWSDLDYHCHSTFSIETDDGPKLVRFRLHGNDDVSSRLSPQEQEEAWRLGRPDIELPSNTYLHQALRDVTNKPRSMKLQAQLRDIAHKSDATILSCMDLWNEKEYPWVDISNIALTYSVPKRSNERAKFNFTKVPSFLNVEVPAHGENLGGLIHVQEKVLTSTLRKKKPEDVVNVGNKLTTYLIHVETGNHLFSGTDAGVHITIYGTKGRTSQVLLDKILHDDFERGSKEAYYVTEPAVGEFLYVKVLLIGGAFTIARNWFLRNIVIFDLSSRKWVDIPCHRWITDRIILPTGKAVTSEVNTDRKYLRRLAIREQQELFRFDRIKGLPGQLACQKYDELPMDLKFASERDIQKKFLITDVLLKLKLNQYVTYFNSFDSFEDFANLARVVPQSEVQKLIMEDDNWKTDEEFGRQFISGVNPVLIRRCTGPIKDFPVTNEMVASFLDRGKTLDQEIADGHIYSIDYPHFENLPRCTREEPRYLADPYVMFYVRQSGELVPIAIQLHRKPGPKNPIWTPNDDELDWLLVKMFVKSADSHTHTMYTHLTRAHLVTEALTMALIRQLPCNHPVYRLLICHTRYAVAGAQKGRDVLLIGEESLFSKILSIPGQEVNMMSNSFSKFHIDDLIPPKDFARRQVEDPEKLPFYHYRDDSLLHWGAISQYVRSFLALYYKCDSDVSSDNEFQAFIKDIKEKGLVNADESPNGCPDKVETLDKMVEMLAMFIFNSSCFHSAMNYGQLDYFGFGPNYPSAMRLPPPDTKGETTLKRIMDTLPNRADQAYAIAFAYYLSDYLNDEIYLLDENETQFTEPEEREILDQYIDRLRNISSQLHERNRQIKISYTYLLPELIPKSASQ